MNSIKKNASWFWPVRKWGVLGFVLVLVTAVGPLDVSAQKPACNNFGAPAPVGDMVAWWTMDETTGASQVRDLAGPPYNDGTPYHHSPGPLPTTIGLGPTSVLGEHVMNSLQFGFKRYVRVTNIVGLDFGSNPFTIDAWVKFGTTAGTEMIVDKLSYYSGGYELYLYRSSLSQPYRLYLRIGGVTTPVAGPPIASTLEGSWVFVAATRARKTVNLYVGDPSSSLVSTSFQLPTSANASSGGTLLLIGEGSKLAIDEVEIFKRALSFSKLNKIFKAGTKGKCKFRDET